jgi:hypothetical protein
MAGVEEAPKKGGSKKWWFIGCGGCLGVLAIIAVATVVLGGMGVNALKEASNSAVSDIFGKTYQPTGYLPIGIPFGKISQQSAIKNMVMLVDQSNGEVIMAFDMPLGAFEAKALKSGNPKEIDTYIKQLGSTIIGYSARSSSSNKLHDIRFNPSHLVKLPNGKKVPLSSAVTEMEKRGELMYAPGAVALLPEAQGRLITLFGVGGKGHTASTAEADFKPGQQSLERKLIEIINASELDDRLQK